MNPTPRQKRDKYLYIYNESMNIFYTLSLTILILFIIRIEFYIFRMWFKAAQNEIIKAFSISKTTAYKPSKYLVIFK